MIANVNEQQHHGGFVKEINQVVSEIGQHYGNRNGKGGNDGYEYHLYC